jgi:hypothetical protein
MKSCSPKRKRGHTLPLDTKGPIPRLLGDSDLEDHLESPKTKFARQFDDLEIHGHLERLDHDITSASAQKIETTSQPAEAPVRRNASVSPRRKKTPQTPSKVNTEAMSEATTNSAVLPENTPRSKSPPLAGELSDEFWHDSEITGHNPDDPEDDGYGINGIGFRPTTALAWSRSQQRKQQLTEYKNREARDARQHRSERRKRLFDDGDEAQSMESSPRKAIRVHFEDG